MKNFIIIFVISALCSCNRNPKSSNHPVHNIKTESKKPVETESNNEKKVLETEDEDPYLDSLEHLHIDTSTQIGKRQYIFNRFRIKSYGLLGEHDTLTDLNYDGYKDYIISFYGSTGTGIKNGQEVYLFNRHLKNYIYNEQLSAIRNPSFYLSDKIITGFYIGNGAGQGEQLEWIRGRWIATKQFFVNNNSQHSVWKIYYPIFNKKDSIIRDYQMIPPREILRTKFLF